MGTYAPDSVFSCLIYGDRNLDCLGTISGIAPAGAQKVSVSTFAQTLNTSIEYHVFPKGDCEGLHVGSQVGGSFGGEFPILVQDAAGQTDQDRRGDQ